MNTSKTDNSKDVKIAFLGDISLNDRYVELYNRGVNPFKEIEPELRKADYVVGNLECIARGDHGENLLKRPRLSTTVETLNYLNKIHISVATLAHNHVYDHMQDGFLKTTDKLKQLGVRYLGAGTSKENASEPVILSQNGIQIGLLNYVTEDTHPNLPDGAEVHLNFYNHQKAEDQISALKESVDQVVVIMHWGGRVENGFYPDRKQPGIAKALISFGTDLIIGHHSHTMQPCEVWSQKHIFYSLGNFCFSDISFDGRTIELQAGKHTEAAVLNVSFSKETYSVHVCPIQLIEHSPVLNRKLKKRFEKRNRRFRMMKKYPWLWSVYIFKLKNIDPAFFYFVGNGRNPIRQLFKLNAKKVFYHLGLSIR